MCNCNNYCPCCGRPKPGQLAPWYSVPQPVWVTPIQPWYGGFTITCSPTVGGTT